MREKLLAWLVPPFLRRLDRYLLLNHPRWWAGKFHYFIFYGLLANLCLAGLVFLTPFPLNQLMHFLDSWVISLSFVVEGGLFIFWLYIQSLFSVEQEYGDTKPSMAWLETSLYTMCVLLIFSPTVIMFVTGVYKTAYEIKTRGHNLCEGPIALEFYYDQISLFPKYYEAYEVRKESLRKALTIADEGVSTGQTVKIIGIEYAIFGLEERPDPNALGTYIDIESNQIVHVESGSAKVEGVSKVFVKRGENISILRSEEKVTLVPGDEIKGIPHGEYMYGGQINIVSGAVSLRSSYRTHIAKREAVIVKEGENVKLVVGETTIHTDSPIWEFPATFMFNHINDGEPFYEIAQAYLACQSVKYFSSDMNTYIKYDIFQFGNFLLGNIILIMLGVFSTVMLKHANWRSLVYSFIYIFVLYIFASIFASIFNTFTIQKISFEDLQSGSLLSSFYSAGTLDIHSLYFVYTRNLLNLSSIGVSLAFLIATILFIFFALILSIRLIKTKKYKPFLFINFVSLPFAFGYFVFILSYQIINYRQDNTIYNTIYDWPSSPTIYILWALGVFFLCYLLFAPILKKALIYFMSLPRE